MKDRATPLFSTLFAASLLLLSAGAEAANWFLPSSDQGLELWVVNAGAESATLWLSPPHRDGSLDGETSFDVPAHGSRQIPQDPKNLENFSQLKGPDVSGIGVYFRQQGAWTAIPEGRSATREGQIPMGAEALFVTNLSAVAQNGNVIFKVGSNEISRQSFSLEPFAQTKFSVAPQGADSVTIEGELNLLGHFLVKDSLGLVPLKKETVPAHTGVQFLMSNSDRSLSFVTEISDPVLIQKARDQLNHPEVFQGRILIAQIAPGSADVNRDLVSPWQGSWSWHVANVVKFAELASQACDGSPEFVEDFLKSWLDSKSPICFWNYRVVKELPSVPGPVPAGESP